MIGKRIGYIVFSGSRLAIKLIFFVTKLALGIVSLFLSLFLFVFRIFLIFSIAGKPE